MIVGIVVSSIRAVRELAVQLFPTQAQGASVGLRVLCTYAQSFQAWTGYAAGPSSWEIPAGDGLLPRKSLAESLFCLGFRLFTLSTQSQPTGHGEITRFCAVVFEGPSDSCGLGCFVILFGMILSYVIVCYVLQLYIMRYHSMLCYTTYYVIVISDHAILCFRYCI